MLICNICKKEKLVLNPTKMGLVCITCVWKNELKIDIAFVKHGQQIQNLLKQNIEQSKLEIFEEDH